MVGHDGETMRGEHVDGVQHTVKHSYRVYDFLVEPRHDPPLWILRDWRDWQWIGARRGSTARTDWMAGPGGNLGRDDGRSPAMQCFQ